MLGRQLRFTGIPREDEGVPLSGAPVRTCLVRSDQGQLYSPRNGGDGCPWCGWVHGEVPDEGVRQEKRANGEEVVKLSRVAGSGSDEVGVQALVENRVQWRICF